MGNWLKKLKENVIRAQLALEIPLARRRGIAARKYWEKMSEYNVDSHQSGLRYYYSDKIWKKDLLPGEDMEKTAYKA